MGCCQTRENNEIILESPELGSAIKGRGHEITFGNRTSQYDSFKKKANNEEISFDFGHSENKKSFVNDIVSPIETVPNSNKASFVNNNNTIVSNNNNISVKFNSKNSKGEEIKLEIHLRENSVKEEQKANKVEPIIVSNFNNNNTINFNDIVVTERPQLSTTLEQSQTSKKVEETQKESTLKEELEIKRQKLFNKLENLKNNLNMPLAREENSNLVNIESKINKNKSGAFKPSKSVMDKAKLLQDHLLGENLEENNNGPIIEQPIVNDKPVIQKKKMKAPILNLN